jgi:superfamily I DNA/RNA helicase
MIPSLFSSLKFQPNFQQKKAIEFEPLSKVLVLAGAGSGKTMVLTNRIAFLAANYCSCKKILALTFTKTAAKEMQERLLGITEINGLLPKMPLVTTFHSFCLRILFEDINGQKNYVRLGYSKRPRLINEEKRKKILSEITSKSERLMLNMDIIELNSILLRYIVYPKRVEITLKEEQNEFLKKLIFKYSEIKSQLNLWDFADFLSNVLYLFEKFPYILENYKNRYQAILIDEFQDTNPLQVMIIKKILTSQTSFFVVGDDDQAIYGFLGADRHIITNFTIHFPGSVVLKLETNYRSTKKILDCANKIFFNKPIAYRKKLIADNTKLNLKVKETKPQKKIFNYEEEMVIWITNKINQLVNKYKIEISEIALLFRINHTKERIESIFKNHFNYCNKKPLFLTIHSAKGMEFDAVFLCDLEEGIFPDLRNKESENIIDKILKNIFFSKKKLDEELEEEKRLLYVGITRAKRILWLLAVKNRELYGKKVNLKPSRFLRYI